MKVFHQLEDSLRLDEEEALLLDSVRALARDRLAPRAAAYDKSGDLELAFLGDTWSACPARHVVPHMLRSVWKAAVEVEAKQNTPWTALRKVTNVATRVLRAVGEST